MARKAAKKKTTRKKTTRKAAPKRGGKKKAASKEMLLVGSKVKAALRASGVNVSADAPAALNEVVYWYVEQAVKRRRQRPQDRPPLRLRRLIPRRGRSVHPGSPPPTTSPLRQPEFPMSSLTVLSSRHPGSADA